VTYAESDHPVEDVQPERREEERQSHFAQEVGHAAIQPRPRTNLTSDALICRELGAPAEDRARQRMRMRMRMRMRITFAHDRPDALPPFPWHRS
jgi:hypothetical protein